MDGNVKSFISVIENIPLVKWTRCWSSSKIGEYSTTLRNGTNIMLTSAGSCAIDSTYLSDELVSRTKIKNMVEKIEKFKDEESRRCHIQQTHTLIDKALGE